MSTQAYSWAATYVSSSDTDDDDCEVNEVFNLHSDLRDGYSQREDTGFLEAEFAPGRRPMRDRPGWLYPVPDIEPTSCNRRKIHYMLQALWNRREANLELMMWDDLTEFEEPYRSAVHAFVVDLFFYSARVPEERRPIPIEKIYEGGSNPRFAKELDEARDRQLAIQMRKRFIEAPPVEESQWFEPKLILNFEVGDFYRPNKMIAWTPPALDWKGKNIFRPLMQRKEALDLFRAGVRNWISRFHTEISMWKEIPWGFSQSVGATKHQEGAWCYTARILEPAHYRPPSKMVNIPRERKEARWACIEDKNAVLTMQWIDENVKSITAFDPRDASRYKPATVFQRMKKAMRKPGMVAYCRDFKKEGLSKPRNLLTIMLEELYKATGAECFRYRDIYDSWSFLDGDQVVTPERGHGLGMAVGLTTFMQICIEEAVCLKHPEMYPSFSMYNNDDAVIVMPKADASKYAGYDRNLCEGIDHAFKAKSTFLSEEACVFCEVYYSKKNPFLQLKNGYEGQELGLPYKAINAAHARHLCTGYRGRIPRSMCDMLSDYWGPALYSGEMSQPTEFGGWMPRTICGVDCSWVLWPGKMLVTPEQYAAREAYRSVSLRLFGRREKKFRNPMKGVFGAVGENLGYDEDLNESCAFRAQTFAQIRQQQGAWDAYLRCLRKVFGAVRARFQRSGERLEIRKLYEEKVANSDGYKDILPPLGHYEMHKGREWFVNIDLEATNPYVSTRLDLMYVEELLWKEEVHFVSRANWRETLHLAFKTPKNIDRRQFDFCGFPKDPRYNHPSAAARVFELRKAGYDKEQMAYNAYLLPPDETADYWIHPINVAKAYKALGQVGVTFVAPSQAKLDAIESRDRYFGHRLTMKEWLMLNSVKPADIAMVASLCRRGWQVKEAADEVRSAPNFGLTRWMWLERDYLKLWRKWKRHYLSMKVRDIAVEPVEKPPSNPESGFILPDGWDMCEYPTFQDSSAHTRAQAHRSAGGGERIDERITSVIAEINHVSFLPDDEEDVFDREEFDLAAANSPEAEAYLGYEEWDM